MEVDRGDTDTTAGVERKFYDSPEALYMREYEWVEPVRWSRRTGGPVRSRAWTAPADGCGTTSPPFPHSRIYRERANFLPMAQPGAMLR